MKRGSEKDSRQAHTLKYAGSSPAPATTVQEIVEEMKRFNCDAKATSEVVVRLSAANALRRLRSIILR